jgi:hypothetical protein
MRLIIVRARGADIHQMDGSTVRLRGNVRLVIGLSVIIGGLSTFQSIGLGFSMGRRVHRD